MRLHDADLAAYLARVGLDGPDVTSDDALRDLHHGHLLAIPFESLDIHLGTPISLEPEVIFDKLVARRRGGFCYENNLLFAAALGALGMEVELLAAEVARADGTFGPPFDHLALRADRDSGPALLDVGFGESFRFPLPIDGEWHDQGPSKPHRAVHQEGKILVQHRGDDGTAATQYRIDPTPRAPHEFEAMCVYQQTSPESGFTQAWVASRATPTGRETVRQWRYIATHHGEREERQLATHAELDEVLQSNLGMAPIDLARLPGPPTTE